MFLVVFRGCGLIDYLMTHFLLFFRVGKLFVTSVEHTRNERATRAMFSPYVDSNKQTKELAKQQTECLQKGLVKQNK